MKHLNNKKIFTMCFLVLFISVPVCVIAGGQITICHIPPGNPENAQTILINENALDEHLAHGDQRGECPCPDTACPSHVKVVNDSSNPVPITGETTVSGSVSIEGTPSVQIIDSKTPFQRKVQCDPPYCDDKLIFTVPDDKLCVIEYFSCMGKFIGPTGGTGLICQILTGVDGSYVSHSLPITTLSTSGVLSAGQMVKIYADPGNSIYVENFLTGAFARPIDLWVSISGYLIDAP